MKAILHIGTEKTGTTSLQHFFSNNRQVLSQQGILYARSPGDENHLKLYTYALDDDKQDDAYIYRGLQELSKRQQWRATFQHELKQEIKHAAQQGIHTVIFSNEHCHSRLTRENEIQRLKELLEPLFSEIAVSVYLRRQDQLAVSLFSTKLKYNEPRQNYFCPEDPQDAFFNYALLLEKWSKVFGYAHIEPAIFCPTKLAKGNLIYDFCQRYEIDFQLCQQTLMQNESLDAKGQHFLQQFNQFLPMYVNNQLNPDRFGILEAMEALFSGPAALPPRAEAKAYYQQFAASNAHVADTWFGGHTMFTLDFARYPEQAPQVHLSESELIAIAAQLWLQQKSQRQQAESNLLTQLKESSNDQVRYQKLAEYFAPSHHDLGKFLMDCALDKRSLTDKISQKIKRA
ncbi:hypothetical protein [Motilimonas cestriensis]|uniref:hypothetical protein n=1 Tax=Motilimonas cestriensis TaxID=2742685 RepID=UPI003DA6224E